MWEGRGGGHLSPFNNWDRVAMLQVCPLDPNGVIGITTQNRENKCFFYVCAF